MYSDLIKNNALNREKYGLFNDLYGDKEEGDVLSREICFLYKKDISQKKDSGNNMDNNIEKLERRYQALFRNFQSGEMDEAAFVSEVDSLQFQDEWGRYWMIGAQSGSWHYYDGQTWHQADPRDADKLPFLDEDGIYWQRGVKSGDWYYYQAESEEWVKPDQADGIAPPTPQGGQAAPPAWDSHHDQGSGFTEPAPYPQQVYPTDTGPQGPDQVADTELFQDDEGRYWSIGAKTGQWYFYDQNGWHPAHEFQPTVVAPPPQPQSYAQMPSAYQPPAPAPYPTGYDPMTAQPYAGQTFPPYASQPAPVYPMQPQQPLPQPAQPPVQQPAPTPQPASAYVAPQEIVSPAAPLQPAPQPDAAQPNVSQQPVAAPQSQPVSQPAPQPAPGPQPAEAYVAPPVIDQPVQAQAQAPVEPAPAPAAPTPVEPANVAEAPNPPSTRTKSGSWFYYDGDQWLKYSSEESADDTPPPDQKMVVDQESEPEEAKAAEPPPDKVEAKEKAEPQAEEPVVAELFEDDDGPPPEVVDVEIVTVIEAEPDPEPYETEPPVRTHEPVRRRSADTSSFEEDDEVRPRRTTTRSTRTRPVNVDQQPAAPAEPKRQARKRTSSDPGRPITPRKRDVPHEPTIIIPTESAASNIRGAKAKRPPSRPVRATQTQQRRARENTLPMEPVTAPAAASKTARTVARRPGNVTQPMPVVAHTEAAQARSDQKSSRPTAAASASKSKTEKSGYTFGDVLRSFPSTFWTFVGGMLVLIIFFAAIIFAAWWGIPGSSSTGSGLAAAIDATPTLDLPGPDQTPTLVPTPTSPPEPIEPPEPTVFTMFSSEDLGLTLEYPDNWRLKETAELVIFSSAQEGLDPTGPAAPAFWIEKTNEDDQDIPDLLADILASFPADAETLNKGSISIASQTWTSTQIRYEDKALGGQGISTIAVTIKDGIGYTLVAVAQAELWNDVQPTYQEMINSFRFGAEEPTIAAQDDEERSAVGGTPSAREDEEEPAEGDEEEDKTNTSSKEESIPTPTPTVEAKPVVHIIKSGDTLLAIATTYGVDVDLLTEENGITNPNSLQLGQEIIIPFTEEQYRRYTDGSTSSSALAADDSSEAEAAEEETDEPTLTTASEDEEDEPAEDSIASAPDDSEPSASEAAAEISGRIVYPAFNPGTNSYDVWMYNIGSGEQTVIAGDASQPTFNRDGSLLAYRSWSLGTRGIFFRDFVGGRGGQVTRFVEDGLPTWSPDGYSFAFSSRREGDRVPRLFRGNQLGDGDESLGFNAEYVTAFPDGSLIAKGCSPSGDCGLYLLGANGLGASKISSEASDTTPAVSPDGGRIAFMSSGRGATNWEIWVMNADGSNPKRLTENGSNEGLPAWSPDGQSLAYVSDQGGVWAIWVMNTDGTNQRKIVNMSGSPDGIVLHDNDNSKGWLEERISWAP